MSLLCVLAHVGSCACFLQNDLLFTSLVVTHVIDEHLAHLAKKKGHSLPLPSRIKKNFRSSMYFNDFFISDF